MRACLFTSCYPQSSSGAGRTPFPIFHIKRDTTTSSDDDIVARRLTITTTELVTELRSSRTDLARIVEAAHRNKLPRLVIPAQSVKAWEQREPCLWARVREWLEAHSIIVLEV